MSTLKSTLMLLYVTKQKQKQKQKTKSRKTYTVFSTFNLVNTVKCKSISICSGKKLVTMFWNPWKTLHFEIYVNLMLFHQSPFYNQSNHLIHSCNLHFIYIFYLESHTLAYARCEVKADDRVVHALKSKLNRESQWTVKRTNMLTATFNLVIHLSDYRRFWNIKDWILPTFIWFLKASRTVSLNQGRYTWRHNSILKHMLTALKGFIEPTNNDLSLFSDIGGYTTTGGTLPVDVIVSKLKPDMVFYNKKDNTVTWLNFEKNIQKARGSEI